MTAFSWIKSGNSEEAPHHETVPLARVQTAPPAAPLAAPPEKLRPRRWHTLGVVARFDAVRGAMYESGLLVPGLVLGDIAAVARAAMAKGKWQDSVGQEQVLTEALSAQLEDLLGADRWTSFAAIGPLWYRGLARLPDTSLAIYLEGVDEIRGGVRFVTAHSVLPEHRVKSRLGGRSFLIDTGMLAAFYQGQPSALEIVDGTVTAIYVGEREVLVGGPAALTNDPHAPVMSAPEPFLGTSLPSSWPAGLAPQAAPATAAQSSSALSWPGIDGKPLPFSTYAELEAFLASAKITDDEKIEVGVTKPRKVALEHNGVRANAIFRDIDDTQRRVRLSSGEFTMELRDNYAFECAAYELARALSLEVVPPAVLRSQGSKRGSIQIWVENAFMEQDRLRDGRRPPGAMRFRRQVQTMKAFDFLIANDDRNAGNILYDADWRMWLIDHTRAFQRDLAKTNVVEGITIIEAPLWEALQSWDAAAIELLLDPYLDGRQIEAVNERRDALVTRLQTLIEQRGVGAVVMVAGTD